MAWYKGSYTGIGLMLKADFMQFDMAKRAEKVAEVARALAPVGHSEDDEHRGRYKASFHVKSGRVGGASNNRAFGMVWNDSPEAVFVEFGSKNNEAMHVLVTALGAASK